MRQTSSNHIKNLFFETNWPYESTTDSPIQEITKKIVKVSDQRLPLGVKLYSPQGVPVNQNKSILSHHFVPNTYRDDKFDNLSIIKSMGEHEIEDTEHRGVDSPLYSRSRGGNRNGSQTPLSRFAATPSSLANRKLHNGAMTPQGTRGGKPLSNSGNPADIGSIDKNGFLFASTPKKLL